MSKTDDLETLLLDSEDAKAKAEPYGRFGADGAYDAEKVPKEDPFLDDIQPSLLTADDIKKYVMATGVIAPFYEGGGGHSRMKDASYEGRIGGAAYRFEPEEVEPKQVFKSGDRVLTVPANSIVFVECDLYFRIPDFIALRFNLQIRHVHRGLLLGTGPLIDPGYWGKLCIPLHNLTDEDYDIPFDEGLIWIEFTKTTKIGERIGRPPLRKEYPEILPFLEKASSRFDKPSLKVGIRSAIPKAVETANSLATQAASSAKLSRNIVLGIGLLGALGTIAALIALFHSTISISHSYRSDMNAQFDEVRPSIRALEKKFDEHIERLDLAGQSENEARASLSILSEMVTDLSQSVAALTSQLEAERNDRRNSEARVLVEWEKSDRRFNGLIKRISAFCSTQTDRENRDLCSKILDEPTE